MPKLILTIASKEFVGHAGRPTKVGGSLPKGAAAPKVRDELDELRAERVNTGKKVWIAIHRGMTSMGVDDYSARAEADRQRNEFYKKWDAENADRLAAAKRLREERKAGSAATPKVEPAKPASKPAAEPAKRKPDDLDRLMEDRKATVDAEVARIKKKYAGSLDAEKLAYGERRAGEKWDAAHKFEVASAKDARQLAEDIASGKKKAPKEEPIPADLAATKSYKPDKERITEIQERMIQRKGLSSDEVVELEANMKQVLDESPLCMRISGYNLNRVIEGGGRFKTQFETGTSEGTLSPEIRAKAEKLGMGTPKTIDPKLRPVYGFARKRIDDSSASGYGDVEVIFKEEMRNRTTVTFGDSLGGFGSNSLISAPVTAPKLHAVTHSGFLGGRLPSVSELRDIPGYFEIQMHGGVSMKDVAGVRFMRRATKKYKMEDEQHVRLVTALEKMGIKVEFTSNID